MKLLLTSGGLTNNSIAKALEELIGKSAAESRVAFIPTAANAEAGDKEWLINDLYRLHERGYQIDLIDIAANPPGMMKRIEDSDVIFIGGGDSFYLSYWLQKSGLMEKLPELLKTHVYAGISAGSMAVSDNIKVSSEVIRRIGEMTEEDYENCGPEGQSSAKTAKFVHFAIRPHFGASYRPDITDELLQDVAKKLGSPIYAIDDQTAIKVVDDEVEIVSEGTWKLYT